RLAAGHRGRFYSRAGAGLPAAHPRLGGYRHLAAPCSRGHGRHLRAARRPEPERRYRARFLPHGGQRRRRPVRRFGGPISARRSVALPSGADRARRCHPLRALAAARPRRSLFDRRPELRGDAMTARLLIAFFAIMAGCGAAHAQSLISGTSAPTISIHSNFPGETITLFGNIEPRVDGTMPEGSYNVIFVVRGPVEERGVRRKER